MHTGTCNKVRQHGHLVQASHSARPHSGTRPGHTQAPGHTQPDHTQSGLTLSQATLRQATPSTFTKAAVGCLHTGKARQGRGPQPFSMAHSEGSPPQPPPCWCLGGTPRQVLWAAREFTPSASPLLVPGWDTLSGTVSRKRVHPLSLPPAGAWVGHPVRYCEPQEGSPPQPTPCWCLGGTPRQVL